MPNLRAAALALLIACPASADVMTLYSNGLVRNYSGYAVDNSNQVADSFSLGDSHILEIDLLVFGDNLLIPPPTVDWAITGTALGGPVYDSGTSDLTYNLLEDIPDGPFQLDMVEVTFAPDVVLAAGDYWLQIGNINNLFGPRGVKWAFSGGSSSAVSSTAGAGPSQSFEILGTPEPGSMGLIGVGLIVGSLVLRRRSGKAPC